jgi:TRAP-type mannitol/chloroaromatic compound transport system permease large subunit
MNRIRNRIGTRGLALAAFLAAASLAPVAANAVVVVRRNVNYHPVARTAVVTGAAVATAVAVGTVVRTIPPSCRSVVVGNVAYQQCGNTFYQPRYAGSQVTYVVVNPPR